MKTKKTAKPLTANEKYLLVAIYGPSFAQMKGQYLAAALANIATMTPKGK